MSNDYWSYEEIKKRHDQYEEQIAALKRENEQLRGVEICSLCDTKTTEISFHFGYGSERDGDMICWECASKIDALLTAEEQE